MALTPESPRIAVFYHIFYEDTIYNLVEELEGIRSYNPVYLFNVCMATPGKSSIGKKLKHLFPGCFIIYTSNKGKDVGAKLALISLYQQLQLNTEYIVLLHDKKSLQALHDVQWKKELFRIVSTAQVPHVLQQFAAHPTCGIIASQAYIRRENLKSDLFTTANTPILLQLLKKYNVHVKQHDYVAGTMFWVRAKVIASFFSQWHPLEVRRTLEEGNVLDNFSGSHTHSWERLFSWIVTVQGFKIQGI